MFSLLIIFNVNVLVLMWLKSRFYLSIISTTKATVAQCLNELIRGNDSIPSVYEHLYCLKGQYFFFHLQN